MFQIGQAVIDDNDKTGFIAAMSGIQARVFLIGGSGLQPINQSIDVIFPDHIAKDIDEHTINRWVDRAEQYQEQPATPEYIINLQAELDRKQDIDRVAREAALKEGDRVRAIFREQARQKMPAWAKAVIVAEHDVDQCDMMTDYFSHGTDKVLILAWSKHTRDVFSEMRKAADKAPETAHMGTGNGRFTCRVMLAADVQDNGSYYGKGQYSHWHSDMERDPADNLYTFSNKDQAEQFITDKGQPHTINFDGVPVPFVWHIEESEIEHREKYSMGDGYYLKDGFGDSTGWKVCKVKLYNGADSVPVGEWRV